MLQTAITGGTIKWQCVSTLTLGLDNMILFTSYLYIYPFLFMLCCRQSLPSRPPTGRVFTLQLDNMTPLTSYSYIYPFTLMVCCRQPEQEGPLSGGVSALQPMAGYHDPVSKLFLYLPNAVHVVLQTAITEGIFKWQYVCTLTYGRTT